MIKQVPALLNLKSYKSAYSLVSSYIKDEKLFFMTYGDGVANVNIKKILQ